MTRIMTNVSAINGQRNLAKTGLKMGKTLEKLASGYRINRAADDAAGLAISEKMRAQIKGNKQALRNAQDGISMLQTAEGAMDEVHTILQRMRELAVQAANGTYADNGPERTSIGEELVQLRTEIDRIAFSTEFNGQKVLTGALSTQVDATGLSSGDAIIATADAGVAGADLTDGDALRALVTATFTTMPPAGSYTFTVNAGTIEMRDATNAVVGTATPPASIAAAGNANLVFSNGFTMNVANGAGVAYTAGDLLSDIVLATNDTMLISGTSASTVQSTNSRPQDYSFSSSAAGTLTLTGADGTSQTLTGLLDLASGEVRSLDFNQLGISITLSNGPGVQAIADVIAGVVAGGAIAVTGTGSQSTLQVGANVPDTLVLDFVSLASAELGSAAYKLGGATGLLAGPPTESVATIQDAHNLMSALDGAIQTLNSRRGTLGAAQNRLEHTINSLGVAVENLTASESRIRDADISELSSDLVASNILQQAGVSVLAQANQTPQAVLQLLQG
jgi:flagellin